MARASRQIKLNKVLIQYCKLVDPGESMDGRSKEYAAQFVIPKDHPQVKEIQEQVGEILKEAFPGANYGSMKKGLRDSDAGGQAQKLATRRRSASSPCLLPASRLPHAL